MELVATNTRLVEQYIALCRDFNDAPKDSPLEREANARIQGFKLSLQAIRFDWGTMLMDADSAAMEQYGEVPMVGGCLLK